MIVSRGCRTTKRPASQRRLLFDVNRHLTTLGGGQDEVRARNRGALCRTDAGDGHSGGEPGRNSLLQLAGQRPVYWTLQFSLQLHVHAAGCCYVIAAQAVRRGFTLSGRPSLILPDTSSSALNSHVHWEIEVSQFSSPPTHLACAALLGTLKHCSAARSRFPGVHKAPSRIHHSRQRLQCGNWPKREIPLP